MNISFLGGIHYGLGACNWEIAITDEDRKMATRQMVLSFVPAISAIACSSYLLFAAPISMSHVIFSFSGFMVTQFVLLKGDSKAVELGLAPKWFNKFRRYNFMFYMAMTTMLFTVYYHRREFVQRKHDPNRIDNIKTAMEVEDADFIKMVDDLQIDYDEADLREIERDVNTRLKRRTGEATQI